MIFVLFCFQGAQRRLYDIANHLGLSTSVIKYIERRSTEDKYIFFGGVIVTVLVMWFIVQGGGVLCSVVEQHGGTHGECALLMPREKRRGRKKRTEKAPQ